MCGIVGQYQRQGQQADRRLIRRMAASIAHRGPDSEAFHFENQVGFGHRRLSLIDLPGGGQPLPNEDRSVWLISNSEIYNYRELRQKLCSRGHLFSTETDSEVIVHLYEDYGSRCVDFLDGMFAFALWDRNKEVLLLARDPIGIKPLYFFENSRTFLFASELKALLCCREIDRTLDFGSLEQYFRFLTVTGPKSIFRGIRQVPPGSILQVAAGELKVQKYWEWVFQPAENARREEEWVAQLRDALRQTVRRTLRSDAALGVLLSGGVDSSGVAALSAEVLDVPLKTYSVAFEERLYDESPDSRLVSSALGAEHCELVLTESEAVKAVGEILPCLDEPFADASFIPTYLISRRARREVKALLSGDGGDELFAGYPWHEHRSLDPTDIRRLNQIPARLNYREEDLQRICSSSFYAVISDAGASDEPAIDLETLRSHEGLNQRLFLDLHHALPSDMLVKMDRMSMLNSLEIRVPYLNRSFLETALRIPPQFKYRQGIRKAIFKKALKQLLPESILQKPKQGFSIPLDIWLWKRGPFRAMVEEVVLDSSTRETGYFRITGIEQMFREHERLERLHGYRLFTLFIFEMWRRFYGSPRGID